MKTKNVIIRVIIISVCTALISCATVQRQYNDAVKTNTVSSYELYLEKYPQSKYSDDVKQHLEILYDNNMYKNVLRLNKINDYSKYLSLFPNGQYVDDVEYKLNVLIKKEEENIDWKLTKSRNSIEAYEIFIQKYPNSENDVKIKNKILELKDEIAWSQAEDLNTIESYKNYLNSYPRGEFSEIAKEEILRLEEERVLRPKWEKTLKLNTYVAYKEFYFAYENSTFGELAFDKMNEIETADWLKTKQQNNLSAYKKYVANFPDGRYVIESEEKMIDLEIRAISSGRYSKLPPAHQTYTGSGKSSEVEIENKTEYYLTLYYSGTEKKKIIISPYKKVNKVFLNGYYKVAARVSEESVVPFVGDRSLSGGGYSEYFYIVREKK